MHTDIADVVGSSANVVLGMSLLLLHKRSSLDTVLLLSTGETFLVEPTSFLYKLILPIVSIPQLLLPQTCNLISSFFCI